MYNNHEMATGTEKRGRPSRLLTDDTFAPRFLEALREGAPLKTACDLVGISYHGYRNYVIHAGENDDPEHENYQRFPKHAAFVTAVAEARAEAEMVRVRRIDKAGEDDWRADAWYLARVHADKYGDKQQVEVTGAEGGPIKIEFIADAAAPDDEPDETDAPASDDDTPAATDDDDALRD